MLKILLEKQLILKLEPAGEKRTIDRKWNGGRRKLTRFTLYYKLFFFALNPSLCTFFDIPV